MRDWVMTMIGALSMCAIHYHFVAKPYLDTQRKELALLKSRNKI